MRHRPAVALALLALVGAACGRANAAGGRAISRPDAISRVSHGYAARLVLARDLQAATSDELTQCSSSARTCEENSLLWVVAADVTGPMPRPSGVVLPKGPPWSFHVLDASTGHERGDIESGFGPMPGWWTTIQDRS